jgi:hypothetical protein
MTSAEYNAFDEMRQLARKTAALVRAAENVLASPISVSDDESRARRDDLADLLDAALEAANATVEAGARLELTAHTTTVAAEEA